VIWGGATGLAAGDSVVRAGLVGAVDGGGVVAKGRGASVTATALVRGLGATGAEGRPAFCGTNGAGALTSEVLAVASCEAKWMMWSGLVASSEFASSVRTRAARP
jgi:hypothetical protein